MIHETLPKLATDVLNIPANQVPETIHALVNQRSFSRLVAGIHSDLRSTDPKLREQAHAALLHLGFPD